MYTSIQQIFGLVVLKTKKFEWNEAMENEFKQIKHVFKNHIRLSPLDPSKRINIITDGANLTGVGFIIFQNGNDTEVGKNVTIIKAKSSALKNITKTLLRDRHRVIGPKVRL